MKTKTKPRKMKPKKRRRLVGVLSLTRYAADVQAGVAWDRMGY